jgi:OOP family OmpA-OmpF porin
MLKKTLISLTLLVISSAANASGTGYLGIGWGQSSIDIEAENFGPGFATSLSDSDTSFKFFGAYMLGGNLAMEAGYTDFGSFGATYTDGTDVVSENIDGDALHFALVGSVPLGQASLFAKLGLARWHMDYSIASNNAIYIRSASASAIDPMYGLGVQYELEDALMLRAEFERFKSVGRSSMTGKADADLISISAALMF